MLSPEFLSSPIDEKIKTDATPDIDNDLIPTEDRGSTVVKVLCYKSEGRWFDPSYCQCIFH